ncbi:bifunctional Delta(1)-pyrroline-2-carboxylate/Delta(1)-piperideine-2-carboxylate reductase [Trinickia caryophylli]|uniref:Ornithine cyclodeaminase n=1 Tax=Trinickia caryophylli TaxID=28094 RepID=A0A1X7GF67_TRICW|nr:bifunctional Delta(1)-pyrroline-2-carboxylate/Delta(1)-piperideine-2-carboxylate reductase [Trinickia caryophylli]PMS10848.1 ornithine cyclodeaminase [Trinickia caryophylli]TRX13878.1 delta(1)-pyrroline-2-carboxylate reductase family protein [Trinickia caryophylli]WQE15469.1 bifunctional Delta(1)-pyrroline-2-carboxylate/Delta(1)-piperideine-2-carboxylate reductase [Trinickia caryophylli]SMF68824.1 ornithine cyclodeaminase [Trinickia caryophylli]
MQTISTFDAAATAELLDFGALVDALRRAAREHEAGQIRSPVRTAVPLAYGGVLLSMPAAAADIAIHKLVSVCPANAQRGIPTIHGTVTVCDGATGTPEFVLDGPTVTGRRTAALSMLGIELLHLAAPRVFLLIGTGTQARFHAEAIGRCHPGSEILVAGRQPGSAERFCDALAGAGIAARVAGSDAIDRADTVITVTTSKTPVYHGPASSKRLVVAVGAFTPDAAEVDGETVRASRIFVDDLEAAREEAGDLLQAGVDWQQVTSLGRALDMAAPAGEPVLIKTVGSGAWDLAAARVARERIG